MNDINRHLAPSRSPAGDRAAPDQDWVRSTLIANQPSTGQRAAACIDMLKDVEKLFLKLKTLTDSAQYAPGGLAGQLRRPEFRRLVTNQLTDLQLKIKTMIAQCGDLLPAAEMNRVRDIEQQVNDIEGKLRGASGGLDIDWSGIANGLTELGKGAAAGIWGAIIWSLQQIFNPGNAS